MASLTHRGGPGAPHSVRRDRRLRAGTLSHRGFLRERSDAPEPAIALVLVGGCERAAMGGAANGFVA